MLVLSLDDTTSMAGEGGRRKKSGEGCGGSSVSRKTGGEGEEREREGRRAGTNTLCCFSSTASVV